MSMHIALQIYLFINFLLASFCTLIFITSVLFIHCLISVEKNYKKYNKTRIKRKIQ
jgi:hypothetical protein